MTEHSNRDVFFRSSANVVRSVLVAAAVVLAGSASAHAQVTIDGEGRRPVPPPVAPPGAGGLVMEGAEREAPSIERFMRIRAPGQPRLSADGMLYVRDWPDGVNQLYRRSADADLDAPWERLTDFEDGLSSYAISPDGKHVILAASAGGSEQNDLHLLDARSGEIKTLFEHPRVVYRMHTWLRDGSGFVMSANEASRTDFHLYHYDLASGERKKILEREGSWSSSDITDDASRLLVGRFYSASHAEVYELDLKSGELTDLRLTDEPVYQAVVGYMPGEQSVVIISDLHRGMRGLFVRRLGDGAVTRPLPALARYEVEGWSMSHDRAYAVVTVNEDGSSSISAYRLPEFEALSLVRPESGVIGDAHIQGQTLAFTLNNAQSPGEAFAQELGQRSASRQLTRAETQGIDLTRFPLPELITYRSFDGLEIPAFLYLPPGYEPGHPIPFIAHYHGGPESQFRPRFAPLLQYLLANGYGIIQPNVRGSTGYGREFHMMDNYKRRWDSVRDGVEAARWLVQEGYSAPGRIAAYGGSYGGFMAVATVIEDSTVYGASVKVVGIVNFITFLEQTGAYRRALREAEYGPLSDREFLASISPINRVDDIQVPMFIVHGLNDPRVPVGEAMQLAIALQRRGDDPELLFFPDEGHGMAKLDNRLLFAERMIRFLNRTIGPAR